MNLNIGGGHLKLETDPEMSRCRVLDSPVSEQVQRRGVQQPGGSGTRRRKQPENERIGSRSLARGSGKRLEIARSSERERERRASGAARRASGAL